MGTTRSAVTLNFVAPVLRVSDLPRSISYYRDRLGFEIDFSYEGFYASVSRDGCRVHLKCAERDRRDQVAFETAQHLDVCFGISNAEALASHFVSSGADLSVPLRSMPYGHELYVRDPDGYILGFIQAKD